MEILRRTPWSRIREQNSCVQRILGDCWQWETNGQCVKGDNCSFRHDSNKRGKVTPSNPSPNSFMQPEVSENHREPEVPEAGVPAVERLDGLARITLEELAITHFVGTLQNACSTRPRVVVGLGEKCSFAHRQVDEQPTKRFKKNDDKSAVTMLKKGNWQERESVTNECHDKIQSSDARQLGCVFQDLTPPKSILRKSTDMPKPIRRVKFTKAIARHTKIRDQNPFARIYLPR